MSCIKIANKQAQFIQKQSFKGEKEHVQRFILAYFKLLIVEKLEVSCDVSNRCRAPLQSLKRCFGFFLFTLDKTLERAVQKAMAQSSQTR